MLRTAHGSMPSLVEAPRVVAGAGGSTIPLEYDMAKVILTGGLQGMSKRTSDSGVAVQATRPQSSPIGSGLLLNECTRIIAFLSTPCISSTYLNQIKMMCLDYEEVSNSYLVGRKYPDL